MCQHACYRVGRFGILSHTLEFMNHVSCPRYKYRRTLYQPAMNFERTVLCGPNPACTFCTLGYQNHAFAVLMLPLQQEVVLSWDRDMRGPLATSPHGSQ